MVNTKERSSGYEESHPVRLALATILSSLGESPFWGFPNPENLPTSELLLYSFQYTVPRSYTSVRAHRETSGTIQHIILTPSYVDDRGVRILPLLLSARKSG